MRSPILAACNPGLSNRSLRGRRNLYSLDFLDATLMLTDIRSLEREDLESLVE
jgi:hypothetical protein